MKKTNKRFAALIAAMALSATMAIPAGSMITVNAAATANTISFAGEVGTHTYKAYKIFSGTMEGGVLKDITWANTSNGASILTALQGATSVKLSDGTATLASLFTSATDAKTTAAAMATITDNSADADILAEFLAKQKANMTLVNSTAEDEIDIESSGDGYYLVIDETSSGDPNAKSKYLLKNVDASEGVEISVKASAPTVEKKVKENVKAVDGKPINDASTTEKWNDAADYNIGDAVPFKLYGTLPSTYADYDHYYYKFTDTLAAGLTAPSTADITVKVNGTAITDDTKNMRVSVSGQNITVSFEDIKAFAPNQTDIITVEYSAILNTSAAIGLNGNENAVQLEYSNNPNVVYNPNTSNDTEDKPNDDNGTPDDTSDDSDATGETPEDKVIVFTYTLEINKTDNSDTKLSGAKFCVKATSGTNANKWVKVDSNGKVSGWLTTEPTADSTEGVFTSSATAGEFITIIGLDDGEYEIKELAAPSGYNALTAPLTWTIQATTVNDQAWAGTPSAALTALDLMEGSTSIDQKNDATFRTVQGQIKNTPGSALPSTGGLGTTLFVLGGGCAAGLAGIYLISRKRTKKEDEE